MNFKFFLFSFFLFFPFFLNAIVIPYHRQRTEEQQNRTIMLQVEEVRNRHPATLESANSRLAILQESRWRYLRMMRNTGEEPLSTQLNSFNREESFLQTRINRFKKERKREIFNFGITILLGEALPLFCSQSPLFQNSFIKWGITTWYTLGTALFIQDRYRYNSIDSRFTRNLIATSAPLLALHFGNKELYGHKVINAAALVWCATRCFEINKQLSTLN